MPVEIAVALITGGVTLANILLSALINYLGRREQRKERSKDIEQQEFDNLKEKVDDIADGMQSLLRNEIIHTHEKWKDRHYCPVQARESLTRAYKAYHKLGGNDVATDLYNDTMSLPTDPNDEDN